MTRAAGLFYRYARSVLSHRGDHPCATTLSAPPAAGSSSATPASPAAVSPVRPALPISGPSRIFSGRRPARSPCCASVLHPRTDHRPAQSVKLARLLQNASVDPGAPGTEPQDLWPMTATTHGGSTDDTSTFMGRGACQWPVRAQKAPEISEAARAAARTELDAEIVGYRLKQIRLEQRRTQTELAEEVQVSQRRVSAMESLDVGGYGSEERREARPPVLLLDAAFLDPAPKHVGAQTSEPALSGGGQGFTSPRMHSGASRENRRESAAAPPIRPARSARCRRARPPHSRPTGRANPRGG